MLGAAQGTWHFVHRGTGQGLPGHQRAQQEEHTLWPREDSRSVRSFLVTVLLPLSFRANSESISR